MPAPETFLRHQHAVLWAVATPPVYDDYGVPKVAAPVELDPTVNDGGVRWLTGRRDVLDANGNTVALDATAIVNQRINVGSRMWLGTLAQWYGSSGSSGDDTELHVVKVYNETCDIKNRVSQRTVGLMKYRNVPTPSA